VDRIWLSTDSVTEPSSMMNNSAPAQLHWRAGIPVIHGSERTIYIGDHRVKMDLSDDEIAWLVSMAASRPDHGISHPESSLRTLAIINYLRDIGAIAEQTECWWLPPPARTALQPHVRALSEWHRDPQAAIAARTTWRIGIYGSGSLADAIAHLLVDCGLTHVDATDADLMVMVGPHGIDAPEALVPAEETDPLHIGERPHLPVSAYRAHASVGPLVVPGRTPCVNCLHLHRRDVDPQWPHLVHQWRAAESLLGVDSDPLVAWQAAISAVSMVRHWIDSGQKAPAHRIRWRFPDLLPQHDVLTAHPSCGCRWAG
jgi:hypothetical protein